MVLVLVSLKSRVPTQLSAAATHPQHGRSFVDDDHRTRSADSTRCTHVDTTHPNHHPPARQIIGHSSACFFFFLFFFTSPFSPIGYSLVGCPACAKKINV
ncbi:hypothetical protein OUZ56_000387 [Daphnia magna]|uniref:Secreted protein n=1 Tax=Daphnia magna TaxID=35525 RepID=A0ABQ9ZZQ7_9CRUS|nr:hypothetical protein OUZ56_000387 [Daphnia magna]